MLFVRLHTISAKVLISMDRQAQYQRQSRWLCQKRKDAIGELFLLVEGFLAAYWSDHTQIQHKIISQVVIATDYP